MSSQVGYAEEYVEKKVYERNVYLGNLMEAGSQMSPVSLFQLLSA